MSREPGDTPRTYWNEQALVNRAAAAIDPADVRGWKNAYIAHCRNLAMAQGLKSMPVGSRLLDYGCGTGTFLSWLSRSRGDLPSYGTDISVAMLRLAQELHPELGGQVCACDGRQLPFAEASLAAICTAITLIYVLENEALLSLAREFRRALMPGGVVVSVEQVRRRTHHQPEHIKIQRAPEEMIQIFAKADFELLEWRPIRRGRFPLVYLIRYGLIPVGWHDAIARLEAHLWRHVPLPQHDYADAVFVWRAAP